MDDIELDTALDLACDSLYDRVLDLAKTDQYRFWLELRDICQTEMSQLSRALSK